MDVWEACSQQAAIFSVFRRLGFPFSWKWEDTHEALVRWCHAQPRLTQPPPTHPHTHPPPIHHPPHTHHPPTHTRTRHPPTTHHTHTTTATATLHTVLHRGDGLGADAGRGAAQHVRQGRRQQEQEMSSWGERRRRHVTCVQGRGAAPGQPCPASCCLHPSKRTSTPPCKLTAPRPP